MSKYYGKRVYWGRTVLTNLGKQCFLIGVRFGLRGLKEQYDLRRYPDSQINIVKNRWEGCISLQGVPVKNKTGGDI